MPEEDQIQLSDDQAADRSWWNLLLLIPVVAVVFPWLYNTETPALFGIPFFYWYQIACVALAVICTTAAYQMTRSRRSKDR